MDARDKIDVFDINAWNRERERKDEKNYERMYKNSVNGERVRRTGKKVKIRHNAAHKKLKKFFGAALVGAALTVGIMNITSDMRDNAIVGRLSDDFLENVVNKECHRTDNNEGFFYDYIDLAETIKGMDDFDEGVYFLVQTIGEYQTDLVLKHTDYGSFANYKSEKGYEDTKEFKKNIKERILISKNIENNKEELERMLQADGDENSNTLESGIGGK